MALIELELRPELRTLRRFGWIALCLFGSAALWALHNGELFGLELGRGRMAVAGCLGGVGLLCAAFSLIDPRANRPLYVGLALLSFPAGVIVSYAALALVFFLVIGPIALVQRVRTPNPMNLRADPALPSYFIKRRKSRPKSSYYRQF
jgi:hypothetical protein